MVMSGTTLCAIFCRGRVQKERRTPLRVAGNVGHFPPSSSGGQIGALISGILLVLAGEKREKRAVRIVKLRRVRGIAE
jgi:hypothetical protein